MLFFALQIRAFLCLCVRGLIAQPKQITTTCSQNIPEIFYFAGYSRRTSSLFILEKHNLLFKMYIIWFQWHNLSELRGLYWRVRRCQMGKISTYIREKSKDKIVTKRTMLDLLDLDDGIWLGLVISPLMVFIYMTTKLTRLRPLCSKRTIYSWFPENFYGAFKNIQGVTNYKENETKFYSNSIELFFQVCTRLGSTLFFFWRDWKNVAEKFV